MITTMMITLKWWDCHIAHIEANTYSLIGFPLTPVTMIILHILRTNSIAFIVSRTLLSLYYQVKLMWFSGRRLTASMSRRIKQIKY